MPGPSHNSGYHSHRQHMQRHMGGNLNGPPSRQNLQNFAVNKNSWEAFNQSLYDSVVYPAAGAATLTLFQNPIGQGTAILGTGPKTLSDTNMRLAGQLPYGIEFLIQSVEIDFQPVTPTPANARDLPSGTGTAAQVVTASLINDCFIFWRSGALVLVIGSKEFLEEAPLMKFPPKHWFELQASLADTTTAGAGQVTRIGYANSRGRPYQLHASPLYLESSQNFSVTLAWREGVQAINDAARIFVTLDGILYRLSQ